MDIGIIGLPLSGKTTVFNALTRGNADTSGASGSATEMHLGVVKVPDPRLEVLAGMYNPRKVVPAEIKYWDVPGPESLAKSQGIVGKYRNILQGADAFLLVVRAFDNPAVAHPLVSVEPGRDVEAMLGRTYLCRPGGYGTGHRKAGRWHEEGETRRAPGHDPATGSSAEGKGQAWRPACRSAPSR